MNSPYLKWIKDFNINPIPDNISVRANVDRQFEKTVYRNLTGEQPNFQKFFYFDRSYSLKWALTKNLTFDYNSRAHSVVDEPDGEINTEEKQNQVWDNVRKLGRLKTFDQNIGANYRLPFDKLPFTDWVNGDYRYSAGYSWTAGALLPEDEQGLYFGHIIQNNRGQAVSGKFDLVKLYNKVNVFKEINSPSRRPAPRGGAPAKADTTRQSLAENPFAKNFLRMLMSLRSVNVTYNLDEGTLLPGYNEDHFLLGMDSAFMSPGWGFVLGDQNPEIRKQAANEGWLVKNGKLTTPFNQSRSEDLSIRATVEPFNDLKIQFDATKKKTAVYQEIFRYDTVSLKYNSLSPNTTGSYSISFFTLPTAFKKDGDKNKSQVFEDFENNRIVMMNRLRNTNPAYDTNSQDVLVPAFLAAYAGKDPNTANISPFPKIPIPNWRIDYSGLGKIEALKKIFSSISITHSYKSSYSISSFTSAAQYTNPDVIDLSNNIENYNTTHYASIVGENGVIPKYVIGQAIISEQFAPFLGINLRTKKRATIRVDYKKQRDLSLNLSNNQVTEMSSNDISFEYGFTKADMKLPFKYKGRPIVLKNDLQFRLSLTVRDTKTVQRKIDDENTVTAGGMNFQLRPNVSYAINKKLNLQVYFERSINAPKVSNSFRRTTTAFGFQLRFSLAQ